MYVSIKRQPFLINNFAIFILLGENFILGEHFAKSFQVSQMSESFPTIGDPLSPVSKRVKPNAHSANCSSTLTFQYFSQIFPTDIAWLTEQYILPIAFHDCISRVMSCFDYGLSGHYELTRKAICERFNNWDDHRIIYLWTINPMDTPDYQWIWTFEWDWCLHDLVFMAACFENFEMIEHLLRAQPSKQIWLMTHVAYKTNQWKLIEIILDRMEGLDKPEDQNLDNYDRALMIGCRQGNEGIVKMCLSRIDHSNPIWERALGVVCQSHCYSIIRIICESIQSDFQCESCLTTFSTHEKSWYK